MKECSAGAGATTPAWRECDAQLWAGRITHNLKALASLDSREAVSLSDVPYANLAGQFTSRDWASTHFVITMRPNAHDWARSRMEKHDGQDVLCHPDAWRNDPQLDPLDLLACVHQCKGGRCERAHPL